ILVEISRSSSQALLLLLEVDPSARETLAARLTDPKIANATLDLLSNWSEDARVIGVRMPEAALLGVEAAVAAEPPGAILLGRIAVEVPGCATRRIAEKLFAALEENGFLPSVESEADEYWRTAQANAAVAFLVAADAGRALALVRRWAETTDEHRRH